MDVLALYAQALRPFFYGLIDEVALTPGQSIFVQLLNVYVTMVYLLEDDKVRRRVVRARKKPFRKTLRRRFQTSNGNVVQGNVVKRLAKFLMFAGHLTNQRYYLQENRSWMNLFRQSRKVLAPLRSWTETKVMSIAQRLVSQT